MHPDHFSVRAGDGSQRSEEIVKKKKSRIAPFNAIIIIVTIIIITIILITPIIIIIVIFIILITNIIINSRSNSSSDTPQLVNYSTVEKQLTLSDVHVQKKSYTGFIQFLNRLGLYCLVWTHHTWTSNPSNTGGVVGSHGRCLTIVTITCACACVCVCVCVCV